MYSAHDTLGEADLIMGVKNFFTMDSVFILSFFWQNENEKRNEEEKSNYERTSRPNPSF